MKGLRLLGQVLAMVAAFSIMLATTPASAQRYDEDYKGGQQYGFVDDPWHIQELEEDCDLQSDVCAFWIPLHVEGEDVLERSLRRMLRNRPKDCQLIIFVRPQWVNRYGDIDTLPYYSFKSHEKVVYWVDRLADMVDELDRPVGIAFAALANTLDPSRRYGMAHPENTPEEFKYGHRAFWSRFGKRARNAYPIFWMQDDDRCVPFRHLYPGDEWVKECGLTKYARQQGRRLERFDEMFEHSIRKVRDLCNKPLRIETGADNCDDKSDWLRRLPRDAARYSTNVNCVLFNNEDRGWGSQYRIDDCRWDDDFDFKGWWGDMKSYD